MKKHFIYALIVSIILSNCFSTAIFAQDLAGPPEVMEITEDMLIPEEAPEVEGYQEAEPFDVALEEEAPEIAVEEADEPEADAALTETPSTTVEQADEPEAIPELADSADDEELTGDGGSCGANATWELSGSMLKIEGQGYMTNYSSVNRPPWYSKRSSINTIFVGDGITHIGSYAFYGCDNLVCVSLPSSLKTISVSAFSNCHKLTNIEIPAGVTNINGGAFNGCNTLKRISFLGSAPNIVNPAFQTVQATVYYPSNNSSWTSNVTANYGGTLTWKPVAVFYDVWVAGIRVNSTNKSDVLGDGGKITYTPNTHTLTMNQTTLPDGWTVSRDFYQLTTTIYAIGDLTVKGNLKNSNATVYVTGYLSLESGDFILNWSYSGEFGLKSTKLNIGSISSGNINLENSELYASGLSCPDLYSYIGIKNSFAYISSNGSYNGMYCGKCEIQDSTVTVERPEGSAIKCLSEFIIGNSDLYANGKEEGIDSPRIKILKGNTIVALGDKGAIFGVEDVMSAPIEIAPGYVFLAPANPIIGTYGIRENGKYATYVSMRPLNSSDLPGIRRGATAVSEIELPTLQTSQLTLKTKDGYYVTGTWSSGNSDIASVDKTGLVKANKYGKTKISCTAGNKTYSCDLQTRFYDVADPKQPGYEKIYWGVEKGIIGGFGGVYFGPEQPCTRLQFAIMLWRSQNKPAVSGTLSFPDTTNLNPQTDSYKAVLWASKAGIINGFSDKTFGPDKNITREQIVIILWRLAGKPKATKAPIFTDTKNLDKNSTSYKAIAWASEAGIVNGFSDKTFRKDENSKRNQIIIMIYRYVNR